MNDRSYKLFMSVMDLLLWDGELIGEENLPKQGPAVFVANHLDSAGPIATCCTIPVRLHPWIIANMMEKELAPAYLQDDFLERQLHLKEPLSRWLAQALCKITIPLFDSLSAIPVYKGDYARVQSTYQISLEFLLKDKFLVVFPEDNNLPMDPVTKMQPFQHSFVRLAEIYYAETGKCLEFCPVAVHETKYVEVGKPIAYNPQNSLGLERRRLKDLIEEAVIAMYIELDGRGKTGRPSTKYSESPTRETV